MWLCVLYGRTPSGLRTNSAVRNRAFVFPVRISCRWRRVRSICSVVLAKVTARLTVSQSVSPGVPAPPGVHDQTLPNALNTAVCLSACLSVCLSVSRTPSLTSFGVRPLRWVTPLSVVSIYMYTHCVLL
jgi:hypothetical protein